MIIVVGIYKKDIVMNIYKLAYLYDVNYFLLKVGI